MNKLSLLLYRILLNFKQYMIVPTLEGIICYKCGRESGTIRMFVYVACEKKL